MISLPAFWRQQLRSLFEEAQIGEKSIVLREIIPRKATETGRAGERTVKVVMERSVG